jgi:hypothetical protein
MAKPALVIDMLAGPGGDDDDDDDDRDEDEAPAGPKEDPEALIGDIRAQLARLESMIRELG